MVLETPPKILQYIRLGFARAKPLTTAQGYVIVGLALVPTRIDEGTR